MRADGESDARARNSSCLIRDIQAKIKLHEYVIQNKLRVNNSFL